MFPINLKMVRQSASFVFDGACARIQNARRDTAWINASAMPLVALMSLGTSTSVLAQTADSGTELTEVVVTGSRIVTRDGYSAPTPVSVLGAETIQSFGSPNMADAVNTLPALAGS